MLIVPAIDIRGGKCVRLFQGDYNQETVYNDFPAEQAKKFQDDGAVLIHLVDLDGAKAGKPVNLDVVRSICSAVTIPCELGGGIRTIEDAKAAFEAGVYRVILGTTACENPHLVKDFISAFGADRVVMGIDAKSGRVAVKGWLETSSIDVFDLIAKLEELGVTRFIYTDISTDGALSGPNLDSVAAVCSRIPRCGVIASGGISGVADIRNLKELGKANLEGVIVGKALYAGKTTFRELDEAAND
ncbi:MAG: 1-(5-phosphoribosyl)-5-[Lentisphaeria bacterium]|nr:1-(5-phosphoribosyl)-5-[(5-phosphoribosylamino)methylideneamino]imidazole-4-carboxamide isomerase [Lentisphaeria bacterium]